MGSRCRWLRIRICVERFSCDSWARKPKIQRFRSGVKNSRVIELHGTNHYVFIVDEALVVREMRKFLLKE